MLPIHSSSPHAVLQAFEEVNASVKDQKGERLYIKIDSQTKKVGVTREVSESASPHEINALVREIFDGAYAKPSEKLAIQSNFKQIVKRDFTSQNFHEVISSGNYINEKSERKEATRLIKMDIAKHEFQILFSQISKGIVRVDKIENLITTFKDLPEKQIKKLVVKLEKIHQEAEVKGSKTLLKTIDKAFSMIKEEKPSVKVPERGERVISHHRSQESKSIHNLLKSPHEPDNDKKGIKNYVNEKYAGFQLRLEKLPLSESILKYINKEVIKKGNSSKLEIEEELKSVEKIVDAYAEQFLHKPLSKMMHLMQRAHERNFHDFDEEIKELEERMCDEICHVIPHIHPKNHFHLSDRLKSDMQSLERKMAKSVAKL